LFSLGVLYETGTGVDRDFDQAIAYYRQSAEGGLADAQINLALEFYAGQNVAQDRMMAVELMQQAAAQGHRLALFNLGAFALENLGDTPAAAMGYFERAGVAGHAQGYYLAATILDDGEIMPKAANRASQLLLMGIAEGDSGLVTAFFAEGEAGQWSVETLRDVQTILTAANQYAGPIDGAFNQDMELALVGWRTGGFRADLLLN